VSTPLSAFLPDVALDSPDCPQVVIEYHAIRVLADFCTQTRYLTETLPSINVVAGTSEYALAPTVASERVVRVEKAWFSGDELFPVDEDELDAEVPGWRTETGTPRLFITRQGQNGITLVPTPDASVSGALSVKVSRTIDITASPLPNAFDSALYQNYGDGLACGIKAKLMLQPGKAWTNPELAVANGSAYALAIARAKAEVDSRKDRARRRTRTYFR